MDMQAYHRLKDTSDADFVTWSYRMPRLASTTLFSQPGVARDETETLQSIQLDLSENVDPTDPARDFDEVASASYVGKMHPLILPRGLFVGVYSPNGNNFTSRALGIDFREGRAFSADRGLALRTLPDTSTPPLADPRVIDLKAGSRYELQIQMRSKSTDAEGYFLDISFTLADLRLMVQSSLVTMYQLAVKRTGPNGPVDPKASIAACFIRGTLIGSRLSLTRVLLLWQGTGYGLQRLKDEVLTTPTSERQGAENLRLVRDAWTANKDTWKQERRDAQQEIVDQDAKVAPARTEAAKQGAKQALVDADAAYEKARDALQAAIVKARDDRNEVKTAAAIGDASVTFMGKDKYEEVVKVINWLESDKLDTDPLKAAATALIAETPKVTAKTLWPNGIGPEVRGDAASGIVASVFTETVPWYITELNKLGGSSLTYENVAAVLGVLRDTPNKKTPIYDEEEFVRPPVFLKREIKVKADGSATVETKTIVYAITSFRKYMHPIVAEDLSKSITRLMAWVWVEEPGVDYSATLNQPLDVTRQIITSLDTPDLVAAGYTAYIMEKVQYGSMMYRLWKTTKDVRSKRKVEAPADIAGLAKPKGLVGRIANLFWTRGDTGTDNALDALVKGQVGDGASMTSTAGNASAAVAGGVTRVAPANALTTLKQWVELTFKKVPVIRSIFEGGVIPAGVPENVYFRETDVADRYEAYTAGFFQDDDGDTLYADPSKNETYDFVNKAQVLEPADIETLLDLVRMRNADNGVKPYIFDADISRIGQTDYFSFVKVLRPLGTPEDGIGGTQFYLDQIKQVDKENEARAASNNPTVPVYVARMRMNQLIPPEPDILEKLETGRNWLFQQVENVSTINSNKPLPLTYAKPGDAKEGDPYFMHQQDVEVLRASLAGLASEKAETYGNMAGIMRPVVRERFATDLVPRASVQPALVNTKGTKVSSAQPGTLYLVMVQGLIVEAKSGSTKKGAAWSASTLIVEKGKDATGGDAWKVVRPDYRLLSFNQASRTNGLLPTLVEKSVEKSFTLAKITADEVAKTLVYGYAEPTPAAVDALASNLPGVTTEAELEKLWLFTGTSEAEKNKGATTYLLLDRTVTWAAQEKALKTRVKRQLAYLILSGAPGLAVADKAVASQGAAAPLSFLEQLEAGVVPSDLAH